LKLFTSVSFRCSDGFKLDAPCSYETNQMKDWHTNGDRKL